MPTNRENLIRPPRRVNKSGKYQLEGKKPMDVSKFKNLPLWALAVWLVILACWMLMGCRTKSVTEYVAVHDTLRTVRTDTVRDVRVVTKTDTLRQTESHFLTVNDRGDTIREIHYYKEVEKETVVDSTKRYQSKVDSLQSIVDKLATKEVVKESSFWERWKRIIDVVVTVVVVGLFVWFLR